jgi:tetratricopeptide (TPR) repeat protein
MTRINPQDTYKKSARRFADHFQQYTRAYEKNYDALAFEIENIFSAIGLYGDLKAWQEVVDSVLLIDEFLDTTGYWEELVAGLHIAIDSADNYFWMQGRDPKPEIWHQRITLRVQLSTLLFRRGEYKEARTYATEALKIAQRIKHRKLEALIMGELGNIAMVQGAYKDAELLQTQSKNSLEALGDAASLANSLERLSILARSLGNLDQAWHLQLERLSIVRKSGDRNREIMMKPKNYIKRARKFMKVQESKNQLLGS